MLFKILKALTFDNNNKNKKNQKYKTDKENREIERKLWELSEEYKEDE